MIDPESKQPHLDRKIVVDKTDDETIRALIQITTIIDGSICDTASVMAFLNTRYRDDVK